MSSTSTHPASHVRIRYEDIDDVAAVRRVNEAAFNGAAEAMIVDALRAAGVVKLSMVAVVGAEEVPVGSSEGVCTPLSTWGREGQGWSDGSSGEGRGAEDDRECGDNDPGRARIVGGEVVGHVLVTPVRVTTDQEEEQLLGLGPVAVLPEYQGQGVGTLLIESCLERLRDSGVAGVVVVGDPAYYARFGFIAADRWGLRWETDAPADHFMALELSAGKLAGKCGVCRYRAEFDIASTS